MCEKNGLKFEIEINKLADIENNPYVLKFKRVEGSSSIFREISNNILSKVTSS
jgi:hypothetical protein